MQSDWLGLALVLAAYAAAIGLVAVTRLSTPLKAVLMAGILMRPVGAAFRLVVLQEVYRGSGDANVYFGKARRMAGLVWEGYFAELWAYFFDGRGSWHGTRFMDFATTMVVSLIGPTKLGTFMLFAALPLIGLLAFAVAFSRASPGGSTTRYLFWILLFPSLWYWPSSIGKEAVLLMGMGITVMGFVGRADRINWPVLAVGLFFVYAIRPEVAAVTVVALVLGQLLSFEGSWTPGRVAQGALVGALGVVGLFYFMRASGVEQLDVEGITSYMESSTGRNLQGDSAIDPVDIGITGIPMALVNILFRPFPWEAGNVMAMLSGVEIWALWGIAWLRRHNLIRALREWRSDRLLRVAVPFILLYSVALGMMLTNLGVIARQRVFLFPFLFLLLEARPYLARRAAEAPVPRTDGARPLGARVREAAI